MCCGEPLQGHRPGSVDGDAACIADALVDAEETVKPWLEAEPNAAVFDQVEYGNAIAGGDAGLCEHVLGSKDGLALEILPVHLALGLSRSGGRAGPASRRNCANRKTCCRSSSESSEAVR